jgi:hypothetical protein
MLVRRVLLVDPVLFGTSQVGPSRVGFPRRDTRRPGSVATAPLVAVSHQTRPRARPGDGGPPRTLADERGQRRINSPRPEVGQLPEPRVQHFENPWLVSAIAQQGFDVVPASNESDDGVPGGQVE